jgi:hypothetical protein
MKNEEVRFGFDCSFWVIFTPIFVDSHHKFGLFGLNLASFIFTIPNKIKGILGSFCKNGIGADKEGRGMRRET